MIRGLRRHFGRQILKSEPHQLIEERRGLPRGILEREQDAARGRHDLPAESGPEQLRRWLGDLGARLHEIAQGDALANIERAHILDVLRKQGGNKARAARVLGVNRRSLYRLIEKFAICEDEIKGESV